MRPFLSAILAATLACTSTHTALAQSTQPDKHTWSRVMSLPSGLAVNIHGKTQSAKCHIKSSDADSVTCVSSDGAKTSVFQRTDVTSIKVGHRGRSTIIGLAIGAGGGAVVGASIGRNGSFVPRGAAAIVLALPGALIGALIGAGTDFSHSTVYTAK